jgi:hypothetical protein
MPTVKVRNQFCVHLGESKHLEGSVLDVTDEQFDLIKHQVEIVEKPVEKKEVKA